VYQPRSQVTPPDVEEGVTTLTLDERPAAGMPVRVIFNGQILSQTDITLHQQQITFEGDYTGHTFEVDYYLESQIDVSQPTPYVVDLPEIELYSLGTQSVKPENDDLGGFDLLLHMTGIAEFDLAYTGNDLQTDHSLNSAITLSVYSDAWVDGQRGWWGDRYQDDRPVAACKLWTLMGAKPTHDNRLRGEQYIKEAVQWLLDDGHLDQIEITTQHHANNLDWLAFQLTCKKQGQSDRALNLNLEHTS